MGNPREFRFPVTVQLEGGRAARASVVGKPDLLVATPPEFRGDMTGVWSPEDLLVAAAASCFCVTMAAVAERRLIPVHSLLIHGTGQVSERQDRRLGFTAIELDVRLVTDPGCENAAERACRRAEAQCLVATSLDAPVRVSVSIETAELALAAAQGSSS
jgi:organic hydroperoxide reductase OsmC/OhrA